jgi:hypothetical protein
MFLLPKKFTTGTRIVSLFNLGNIRVDDVSLEMLYFVLGNLDDLHRQYLTYAESTLPD